MHNPVVWNRFLWSKFISATCNNKEKKKKKKGKYVPSSRFLSHSSVHPTYGTRVESTFISICATTRSWRGKDGQNKLWPDSHNPAFTTESSVEWMAAIKFCWVAIYNKDTALEIYAHVRSLSEPQVKRRYTRVGVWWGRKCRTEGNHARRSLWKPRNRKSIELEPCSVKWKSRTPIMTITERLTNKTTKKKPHFSDLSWRWCVMMTREENGSGFSAPVIKSWL